MWQKARTIKDVPYCYVGREVWLDGQPYESLEELLDQDSFETLNLRQVRTVFRSNITIGGLPLNVRADCVELLPEFAETVETVEVSEWR